MKDFSSVIGRQGRDLLFRVMKLRVPLAPEQFKPLS
jgi:hypothetical protein